MNLVSVILPLYKSEAFIAETLSTVLAQSHNELEVIVVDDGSPDNSADLCEAIGDPRVRVFRRTNTGACRSRNFGITQARGEFIAFIDHDDHWLPEKLERHLQHLARAPDVGVSFGPSEFMDESGQRLGLYQVPKLRDITARDILCRNPIGNGSVPVIRRELFDAVGFTTQIDGQSEMMYFDADCVGWEDVELWFRMIYQTNWKFEGIPDCLTLYRLVPDGVSGLAGRKQSAMEAGLERVSRYAGDFVSRHRSAALGYHLRYLARRLIQSRDASGALTFALRSIRVYPRLLIEEPGRTLITLAAAIAQILLPARVFRFLENHGRDALGRSQANRIST